LTYLFTLEGNPIAEIWHYSELDEEGECKKTNNHKRRNNHVYVVRGNWALEKRLMKAGACGYIDEIDLPGQEVGCMCRLQWIYAVRNLPASMQTSHGRAELSRVRTVQQTSDTLPSPTVTITLATGPMSLVKRWFGRR
jgi:hypothetical protein